VRLVGLAGVGVMLLVALLVGRDDPGSPGTAPPVDLAPLRTAAALEPCPAGLGPELPALVLPCLGGGPDVALNAAPPGRPTLVNLWATWCVPCREEVPALVAFADRAGDRVGVVGVLTNDTQVAGLAFARDYGMRYPNVVDDDRATLGRYGGGPPITLLLDADGRVVHVERGKLVEVDEVAALVQEHLGVTV
jgi:thiol-disulfide isomerase/thioredoxin